MEVNRRFLHHLKFLLIGMVMFGLLSCSEETPQESSFDSNSEFYAITFISSHDKIRVWFENDSKALKVKGLKFKYLIPYADLEQVIYRPIDAESGYLVFKLLDKENQLGIISNRTFSVLQNESDIPLKFQIESRN